ncbi:nucleotidyltransferase family protein [Ruixingdingia sedimenti]|uniref:Nucleotidyltransferase family protein n=1 Tax=Ruixingdingia sedimenti TaxID=3073604 RepID=A0ABU1F895_9RHOB|nr:nucleotidyltransferase family protein [Xinfangfangia sp. LG-4]MDR5652682.1 nucleotidyltransferase family protein [Xinfangfangia sp. LG-4]
MRHDPDAVMLFAAGFGTRMGALTATRPKPLVPVAGRALIDHALALADGAGVARKVVNLHYLGDQIAAHLAGRADVALSWEPEILETGGGLRAALPLLGPGPVFTLNTDAVWTGENPLSRLRSGWDPAHMRALLLLAPADRVTGHSGKGDFALDDQGRITRGGPLVYLGAQIVNPAGIEMIPGAFSLNRLWDAMIAGGTAHGMLHHGGWCDVGRPEGIALAEAMLQEAGRV